MKASMLLNGATTAAMAEWCGGIVANCHGQFVKGGPLWWHHRLQ